MGELPSLSAVMPVYNGLGYLERSLPPLMARVGIDLLEVIVVDDSSTDGSAAFAEAQGARVLPSGGRLGPGGARNGAAQEARGDVLLFVDADVVIHPDVPRRMREAFDDPARVAVFGSYDDRPPDPGFVSQYTNLRHHFTHHQNASDDATTFWAGCGAVRRDAFLAAGGFDLERFPRPSIEDIELGYRLRAAGGHIRLDPSIQATHLKRWRLRELLETDIFRRAIPWARLLLSQPEATADLNVTAGERGRAVLAGVFSLILLAAVVGLVPLWLPALGVVAVVAANRPLFELFRRRRGLGFALAAILFHQLYFLYATATFVGCSLEHRLGS